MQTEVGKEHGGEVVSRKDGGRKEGRKREERKEEEK